MDVIGMVVKFQGLGTKLQQMEVEAKLFSQWKKGPWLFRGKMEGMKSYPVMWGLFHCKDP